MTHIIYALVCPKTRLVQYVGRTAQTPAQRLKHHLGAAKRNVQRPLYAWIRSIAPQEPIIVVLQEVKEGRVARENGVYESVTGTAETKWIKRFRRTVLNERLRDNSAFAWDKLVNHDEKQTL